MSDDDEDYDDDFEFGRKGSGESKAPKKKGSSRKSKTVEEIPDTYIGSVEKHTQPMWVLDKESKKIVQRQCTFVPGLYKIFDEILVNAADNKQRDPSMSKIEVTIDREDGFISVFNNGKSIPVVVHRVHNVYIPELVFGHLLTGSNFDDNEEKTTGGRNGYGAKLANIFSKKFIIEVGDSTNNFLYKQEFQNNMTKINSPKITKYATGKDYTKVTFYPDFPKFHMTSFADDDILDLLSKRVYDIAGCNITKGAKLNVTLNKEKIDNVKKFDDYLLLYQNVEPAVVYEKINERWEVAVGPSDGSFQQISFVNSICTSKGGSHVNYLVEQITSRLIQTIKKKSKNELKPAQIKNQLVVYINCLITNPSFDSQTKENLTTKASSFGSTCQITEKIFKAIEKSTIIDNILNWAKAKQSVELKKKSGSKRSKLLGITKLDDANFAGTPKSSKCTLILTEGDSAKALAISGLGVVGRDYYGVFPLKGKLLNVREASHQQIMKNEEIQNITKILGLTYGKTYTDTTSLRYGHLMIMTDQDHDGSHIKGLLINYIHYFWPSLLQMPGFLLQFITPIVKCFKGKEAVPFYTLPEYQKWKEETPNHHSWRIKYYKGLGTSTAQEAKEYFSDLSTHKLPFQWDDQANDVIDLAFAKKRVDDRKLWLLAMKPGLYMNYKENKKGITYNNFINQELILFSHADNERSIAHFMDGLKPSQRKVLFSCFKRNLTSEIKVAQLAGYISEHSAYHHGEASLTQTIIGMAQNFVGSNNINLLSPCGQFGTRLMGGKDAASPRYVFTKLEEITRCIFHPDDDNLLDYLEEDGQSIEPSYYVPIIPMALVNGSEGIGTGWSSTIPNYNPLEIIANLKKMIAGEEPEEILPWYRGFIGSIQGKEGKNTNFAVTGIVDEVDDQTLQISELPIGKWTTDYKQYLESVLIGNTAAAATAGGGEGVKEEAKAFVKDFKENHTDTTVLFTVTTEKTVQEMANEKGGLVKRFKLESSISTTNMNLFDINSQIKKYESPVHLMKEFFPVRLDLYHRRKNALCAKLEKEFKILENKMRFIGEIIDGKLIINNRKKTDILNDLVKKGYDSFPNDASVAADEDTNDNLSKGYDYLLSLKLWNLTVEKIKELNNLRDKKQAELNELKAKTPEMIWLEDLTHLEKAIKALFTENLDENTRRKQIVRKKSTTSTSTTIEKKPTVSSSSSNPLSRANTGSSLETTTSLLTTSSGKKTAPVSPAKKKAPARKKSAKVSDSSSEDDEESSYFSDGESNSSSSSSGETGSSSGSGSSSDGSASESESSYDERENSSAKKPAAPLQRSDSLTSSKSKTETKSNKPPRVTPTPKKAVFSPDKKKMSQKKSTSSQKNKKSAGSGDEWDSNASETESDGDSSSSSESEMEVDSDDGSFEEKKKKKEHAEKAKKAPAKSAATKKTDDVKTTDKKSTAAKRKRNDSEDEKPGKGVAQNTSSTTTSIKPITTAKSAPVSSPGEKTPLSLSGANKSMASWLLKKPSISSADDWFSDESPMIVLSPAKLQPNLPTETASNKRMKLDHPQPSSQSSAARMIDLTDNGVQGSPKVKRESRERKSTSTSFSQYFDDEDPLNDSESDDGESRKKKKLKKTSTESSSLPAVKKKAPKMVFLSSDED